MYDVLRTDGAKDERDSSEAVTEAAVDYATSADRERQGLGKLAWNGMLAMG